MGLGRFGGGEGVARWLAQQGAAVLVTDLCPASKLERPLAALDDLVASGRISLRLGGHATADFAGCDLVVANPAVPRPWENPYLAAADAAGAAITAEIRLLAERIDRRRVIGVTGSAGKSTTAAMIHHILVRAGRRAHLGGNIGGSLLLELGRIGPEDLVVLELSSAMLYWLGSACDLAPGPGWSPAVAVLTNLEHNHLDWHGSFEHYRRCKEQVFSGQGAGDVAIRGGGPDPGATPIPLSVPGAHNQRNARLAVRAAGAAAGLEAGDAAALLGDFAGLPHRLRLVAEAGGVRFFDDSKSTTPAASRLAVEAFEDPGRVHLIAGGYDKGIDLAPLAHLAGTVACLYTIGATGAALREAGRRHGCAEWCGTLEAAVALAAGRLRPGDVLLLSPGCASWDQFSNYQERGEAFARLVAPGAMGQRS